jgi:hypothetical protein
MRKNTRRLASLILLAAFLGVMAVGAGAAGGPRYLWHKSSRHHPATLADSIPVPNGFERIRAAPGSFAEWLRNLPLNPPGTPVRLYDGRLKWSQDKHVAVIDIDTGTRDLQQCADAVMRLRAEYLLSMGRTRDIVFHDSKGKRMAFHGSEKNYSDFRRYMNRVFTYAGSYSLARELKAVPVTDIQIGDVFIQGGFPGHAVLVIDMAVSRAGREKIFLLMQSFMPAQDMHILRNLKAPDDSPWFRLPAPGGSLVTPEWIFPAKALKRFRE